MGRYQRRSEEVDAMMVEAYVILRVAAQPGRR